MNLSHNQIESLEDDTFIKNLELKTLDISYNLLEELGDDTLDGLEVLEVRFSMQEIYKFIFLLSTQFCFNNI